MNRQNPRKPLDVQPHRWEAGNTSAQASRTAKGRQNPRKGPASARSASLLWVTRALCWRMFAAESSAPTRREIVFDCRLRTFWGFYGYAPRTASATANRLQPDLHPGGMGQPAGPCHRPASTRTLSVLCSASRRYRGEERRALSRCGSPSAPKSPQRWQAREHSSPLAVWPLVDAGPWMRTATRFQTDMPAPFRRPASMGTRKVSETDARWCRCQVRALRSLSCLPRRWPGRCRATAGAWTARQPCASSSDGPGSLHGQVSSDRGPRHSVSRRVQWQKLMNISTIIKFSCNKVLFLTYRD